MENCKDKIKIRWNEINRGSYPENFLNFTFKIFSEKDDDEIPEWTHENFDFALSSIDGLTRRKEIIKYYFQNQMSIRSISSIYNISELTVRHDIKYIAKKFLNSINLQNIMKNGECLSNDYLTEEEILNLNIRDLDLPCHIFTSLNNRNIKTIKDLSNLSFYEISRFRNIGNKSLETLIVLLDKYGLKFKECESCYHKEIYCYYYDKCKSNLRKEGEE